MKIKTVATLKKYCKDWFKDDDGYWFFLKPNYIMENYWGEKTIHEDTLQEVKTALQSIEFRFVLGGE